MQVGNGKVVCIANHLAKIAVVWRWLDFSNNLQKMYCKKFAFVVK